jgi:hypothetical protein
MQPRAAEGVTVNKLVGVIGLAAAALAFSTLAPAQATTSDPASSSTLGTVALAKQRGFSMKDRFARERTRYGDEDASTRAIDHVTELQYRLRWADKYDGPVTGYFGTMTRTAVKRYQRSEGLNVNGVATHTTWKHLIRDTIRHPGAVPRVCKRSGWHACYDRSMHQVTLWRGGRLHNAWLVRGGSASTPTRLGTNRVYYRDKDHRSGLFDGAPMPYSQFFDGGQALHGSALMMDPFVGHSHGCVNMYIEDARQLWRLTSEKRLVVTVYGAWD